MWIWFQGSGHNILKWYLLSVIATKFFSVAHKINYNFIASFPFIINKISLSLYLQALFIVKCY